jgi:hypothetical protein
MKHTWTIDQLSGYNRSQTNGEFIEDFNREFSTKGVVNGVSILYNKETNESGLVTTVTDDRVDALGVKFKRGDPYVVTLATDWTMQNDDGPLIEVECSICGFSYPTKDLTRGRCKTCIDKPQRS